jgi:GNAT superfamily N-acetyltransferase
MNKYTIRENYRDDEALRNKFHEFVRRIFPGADFSRWHEWGYWRDEYIPFSIVRDDQIIANVSASRMKLFIDGQAVKAIQIGTVGTLSEYRKQSLSRILMEYVLDKYKDSADIFFLFANDTVLKFYTRFGFELYNQVIFKSESHIPAADYSARQLDIGRDSDIAIIKRLLGNRQVISKLFGAADYDFVTAWHILNVYPNNLHYLEDEDIIMIISEDKGELHIRDIIHAKPFDIDSAISRVIRKGEINSIYYYFSPDQLNYKYDGIKRDDDSPLFVRGYFPIAGRDFKFPITAET